MTLPSVDEARARMLSHVGVLRDERVALTNANGRVLREDVRAERDQPPFDVSAMDGWAVLGDDLPGLLTIVGESAAGHGWAGALGRGQAVRISTGAAMPAGADCVVIQEEAVREGGCVRIGPPVAERYIRARGADFKSGDTLLTAGSRLNPWRLALAASAGRAELRVSVRPRVAIVATGDELAKAGTALGIWQIHDSVGPGLCAWFGDRDCEVSLLDTLPDNRAEVSAALQGVDCDLLITIGGASVGDHDVIKPALRDLGLEIIVEGVAVRPGKPSWFGLLGDRQVVLGLPGNPVSAMVCAELFATPIIAAMQAAAPTQMTQRACLGAALPANGPREHFMRAQLYSDAAGGLIARAAADQDSSLVSVLADAGGLMRRLPSAPAAAVGDAVDIIVLNRTWHGP